LIGNHEHSAPARSVSPRSSQLTARRSSRSSTSLSSSQFLPTAQQTIAQQTIAQQTIAQHIATNSPRSYGWATLIAAGGGAYYFAKKSINADRAAKADADRQKRARQFQLEQAHGLHGGSPASNATSSSPTVSPNAVVSANTAAPRSVGDKGAVAGQIRREDETTSPSVQANSDPAATRHAPEKEGEKSKYEASDVFRSRKGDRFS
jgi:hypothetical protein